MDPQTTKSTYRCGYLKNIQPLEFNKSHGDIQSKCCCGLLCNFLIIMQIIHTDSNTVLGQNDTGFSCDGSANTFRVMFKEPVEILPNVSYTACATLKVWKLKKYKLTLFCF